MPLLIDSKETPKPEMTIDEKENLRIVAMERLAILRANKKR